MRFIFLFIIALISTIFSQAQIQIILDDFADSETKWQFDANTTTAKTNDGLLYLRHKNPVHTGWFYKNVLVDPNQDFSIETTIKIIAGNTTNCAGITWGGAQLYSQHRFGFSSKGNIEIISLDNKKKTKHYVSNDKIPQGMGKTYQLQITQQGDSMRFFINNELLYTSGKLNFIGYKFGIYLSDKMFIASEYFKLEGKTPDNSLEIVRTFNPELSYSADFSSSLRGWQIALEHSEFISLKNKTLRIKGQRDQRTVRATTHIQLAANNVYLIEADLTKISGVSHYGYGIIYSGTDSVNFSSFSITGSGDFALGSTSNNQPSYFTVWKKSNAIQTTNGSKNSISILKLYNKWYYYINNSLVYSNTQNNALKTTFGFFADLEQEIEIENFKIYTIP